jgi:hypothetical protein
MDAASLDLTLPRPRLDADRLRDMVLVRVVSAGKPLPRETVVKDLAALADDLIADGHFEAHVQRDLAALADAGLVELKASSAAATGAGEKRVAMLLGGRGGVPKSWAEARNIRLIARALWMENEPPKKLAALAKADGLKAAIIMSAYRLKLRGPASPVRLRQALARVALSRVLTAAEATVSPSKSGMSATAERALAGRLSTSGKTFRTDQQLIAALAAEHVGADMADLARLQDAILRRSLVKTGEAQPPVRPKRTSATAKAIAPLVAPRSAPAVVPPPPLIQAKPTLIAFADDILKLATPVADGFAGNRRAWISKVWTTVQAQRPHWGLTEVEFKAMLTEAHRSGHLVLANADLRDERNLRDVQASAVTYRNTVFHYVRVDG